MSELRFSVVIPTMNRLELLRDTLASLHACEPPPDEVIIVDASEDASARAVVAEFQDEGRPAVHYLHAKPSLTAQRNRGIDEVGGDVVVFLDDDVELERHLFARLERAYLEAEEDVVGVTGHIIEDQGKRKGGRRSWVRHLLPGGGREGQFTRYGYPRYVRRMEEAHDVEYMLGCFMSARRAAAAQVRFDERMNGYALAEDEDFSYRLSKLGRIRYLPELVVHHRKLGFSSMRSREFGHLVVANRTYLFRKNFPQTRLARAQFQVLILILIAHRLVNREWNGARGLIEGVVRERRRRL